VGEETLPNSSLGHGDGAGGKNVNTCAEKKDELIK